MTQPGRMPNSMALLLTPGASATRDHPSLVVIDGELEAVGVAVERIDLPSARPGPAVMKAIADGAGSLAARAGVAPADIVLGGRSFGGRMCSVAAADGLPAVGLALLSYPLHPPGRPEQLRIEHFARLSMPCLFVSGTRDAFGTPAELEAASAAIPGPVTHVWIDGGDHGMRRHNRDVALAVRDWVLGLAGPRG
ncbi:MAG TPA: alpha/beta family hydrolase [Acidimicrobiales bacterium]|nr:alpha/beta family hydrolase [Acidimicrobiales bacterium]